MWVFTVILNDDDNGEDYCIDVSPFCTCISLRCPRNKGLRVKLLCLVVVNRSLYVIFSHIFCYLYSRAPSL